MGVGALFLTEEGKAFRVRMGWESADTADDSTDDTNDFLGAKNLSLDDEAAAAAIMTRRASSDVTPEGR